ncbi:MAG: DUF4399 domain-containing protein [Deltaproteobacteria bacterium]|nr:DUF4399 domain-containing protein [Deltaproteobacteria bacterium]
MKQKVLLILILVALVFPLHGKTCETHQKNAETLSKIENKQPQILRAKSSKGAKVFFVNLKDGQELSNPIKIQMGSEGIAIEPAGEVKDNSGHHHLLVDLEKIPALDQSLPMNDQILHFGKAQTEAEIQLSPGKHTLQLLLAGGNHVPHDPVVKSKKITIVVK